MRRVRRVRRRRRPQGRRGEGQIRVDRGAETEMRVDTGTETEMQTVTAMLTWDATRTETAKEMEREAGTETNSALPFRTCGALNQRRSRFHPGQLLHPSSTPTATNRRVGRVCEHPADMELIRSGLHMLFLPISTTVPPALTTASETGTKSFDSALVNECSRCWCRWRARWIANAVGTRELAVCVSPCDASDACFTCAPAVPRARARTRSAHSHEASPTPPAAAWTTWHCIERR